MNYKVILTGATGMVGEGVLLECLAEPQISAVLSVSRRSSGMIHPKLTEYLVADFLALQEDDATLTGYDACFYCAGISSIGKKEAEFTHSTFDTTIHFARVLLKQNPQMTFVYVSGAGTDSTGKSRLMWARVKGKTENTLAGMPFRKVYNFRPGFMKLTSGQKNALKMYRYVCWMYPILRLVLPNGTSTMKQVGRAMINCLVRGFEKQTVEVSDINKIGY